MITELTPQVLMTSMALIIVVASLLTVLLCSFLLWRYRRAVTHAMAATSGFPFSANIHGRAEPSDLESLRVLNKNIEIPSIDLYQKAIRGPWRDVGLYTIAIFSAALLFATAAQNNYSFNLRLPGFFVGVWIYAWPIVLVLPLIVPGSMQMWLACVTGYFLGYSLLGLWASTVVNIPAMHVGGITLPARSSVQPFNMISLWIFVNALPTILTIACFHRRVRAVAPLVLGLVTTVVTGTWFALVHFSGPTDRSSFSWVETLGDTYSEWLMFAILILLLMSLIAVGWTLVFWIAQAYRKRKLSDRSLLLDALWLVFACTYSMWLVMGGLGWIVTAPAGFLIYKVVLAAGNKFAGNQQKASRGLTFLRVFSLGSRSEALLEDLAKYWRNIGSVQMITGPDVASSTVQPHQFLDFLSGKLSRHFVGDPASLERSLAERDFEQDPDGRFRINSLFFHADSWQPALPRLAGEGDVVLMDLRNFSASNNGCIHELHFLAAQVPFDRCVLVGDNTTDKDFLQKTLKGICSQLPPKSPNHGHALDSIKIQQLETGVMPVRQLVQRLCHAV